MQTLNVLSTTDVHGYLHEGIDNLIDKKQQLNCDLLIDNGDFFVGHSFATFAYLKHRISPLVDIANELGYDVMIPGNHDLDFGLDWLKKQVEHLNADYLCMNLFDTSEEPIFKPYLIKEIKGIKVGIVGLMTGALSLLLPAQIMKDLIVTDPIETLNRWIDKMSESADIIIVAYHGGLTNNPETGAQWHYPSKEDEAYQLMTRFPQINAVICGHQHFVNAGIYQKSIGLVQPGARGQHLGYQQFSVDENQVFIKKNEVIPLESQGKVLTDEKHYADWLKTAVDKSKLINFITSHFDADAFILNYQAKTYAELIKETDYSFPLNLYMVTAEEFNQSIDNHFYQVIKTENMNEAKALYVVIATPNIMPTYRIKHQFLVPLFDCLVVNQACN